MEYSEFKKLIDALISRPTETEWVEFKDNFHSNDEIGERIAAISNSALLKNMSFGYIVFGVDDKTHKVVGTNFYPTQKKVGNEELESWLSTRLNPRIDFEIIDNFDYEDKGHVCIFKIPATVNRPVSFLNIEYIRVGSVTRKLKDFPQKESKIWKGNQKAIESIVLKSGLTEAQVMSLLSSETYFDMMHLPIPSDTKGVMDRFLSEKIILIDPVGYSITELGALLLAKNLADFDLLRRKSVRVIVYKGKNKLDTTREQQFNSGYALCFKNLVDWINGQLPMNEEIGTALRTEVRMYPEIAVREIVANMLIHQDLAEQGFPMVEIYPDRIDFSNSGQPVINYERFIDEYSSRNDSLADMMRRMGICEEKGSGLDKVVDSTLFSYRKLSQLSKMERIDACYQHACLKYVSNDKMTNKSLRQRLGIDDKNYPMASRIIRDSIDAKLIKEDSSDTGIRHCYLPYWA